MGNSGPEGGEFSYYTPSNVQCTWQDAEQFKGRLRQLEVINHAILTLSSTLWMEPNAIDDYEDLHRSVLTYKDSNGRVDPSGSHDWNIIANDPSFLQQNQVAVQMNTFGEFLHYFENYRGVSKAVIHGHFKDYYLKEFRSLRDWLTTQMAAECRAD